MVDASTSGREKVENTALCHSDLSTTLRYFHLTKMGHLDNEKILNDVMNDQNREDDNA